MELKKLASLFAHSGDTHRERIRKRQEAFTLRRRDFVNIHHGSRLSRNASASRQQAHRSAEDQSDRRRLGEPHAFQIEFAIADVTILLGRKRNCSLAMLVAKETQQRYLERQPGYSAWSGVADRGQWNKDIGKQHRGIRDAVVLIHTAGVCAIRCSCRSC